MPEEKVTEGKETEEKAGDFETWVHQYPDVDSGKLVRLHALLKECVSLARETVEAEFPSFADDPKMQGTIAEMTGPLAAALFHKASVPDQTETMLAALERGLKWYGQWQEGQKAESAKISADFQKSISAVLPKPVRKGSQIERLMRFAEASQSSMLHFIAEELATEQEAGREAKTETGGEVPTSEE